MESNAELFYIEHADMTKSRAISSQKKQLRKIDNIDQHYKISYKFADLLGNGAFGTVRSCTKIHNGKEPRNAVASQIVGAPEAQ